MRWVVLAAVAALAGSPAQALTQAAGRWIGSWGASPAPPMPAGGTQDPRRMTPSFNNQTVAQVVRLSAGGARLRVRLTNEYGSKPLAVGAARVVAIDADGKAIAGTEHMLSFAGAAQALIPPNAPMVSDPVALTTRANQRLRISLYLPGETGPCTCHFNGNEAPVVADGDATGRDIPKGAPADYRAFLSGVEVEAARPDRVIVTLGDSITDGARSTQGRNARWPDRLSERLAAAYPSRAIGVVNAGISGNRVLSDGVIVPFGQNALSRFDRDVLSVPGVTDVIVLEGINDIGALKTGPGPTAAQLIAGYRQLIDRAHGKGLRIIGATLLPYEGAAYFTTQGEAVRAEVNAWIRRPGNFDAVIDLDAAMRDPAQPTRFRADLQSGDWLHPNDAGYRVMGDAVNLALFR